MLKLDKVIIKMSGNGFYLLPTNKLVKKENKKILIFLLLVTLENFTETSLIMLIIFLDLIFIPEYQKIMIFLMTTFKSTFWQHQELVFEDISTFDPENPIVGSLLREIDLKKNKQIVIS